MIEKKQRKKKLAMEAILHGQTNPPMLQINESSMYRHYLLLYSLISHVANSYYVISGTGLAPRSETVCPWALLFHRLESVRQESCGFPGVASAGLQLRYLGKP